LITGFRILKSLQQKKVEILKLQKEFTQTQFEALKNQLNPHFLFNSLSVLTSLIHADAEKAEIFIDKLARTYRYLLDQRDIEAVEISKEMEFLDHFQFLVFQRYGNKLVIEKEDSFASENYFLLPHTLLIVLEEIIGNNTMSFSRPLKIVVTIKNRFLFIRYSNQPKEIQKDKTENQFSALLENYRHISKEISILEDDYFQQKTIRIPLITA
jgi:LytS/YehU family sensor histidine kinase